MEQLSEHITRRAGITDCMEELDTVKTRMAEMLKENNQFTYIVTHDLQAPLRMVTGFLELLEKKYADKLDDTAKQYIEYAVKGSLKMKNLVFDLLEYSRLSSITYEFEDTDLSALLDEAKIKLAGTIESTGAIIKSGPLPRVRTNKKLMLQLLGHLLDNALKFRRETVPQICVEAEKHYGYWKISIRDQGLGIDPAFFERIFVVFKKLHTDELKYPGTGIGLAICKKITELHAGTIGVESVLGEGSTFSFTIPQIENPILT